MKIRTSLFLLSVIFVIIIVVLGYVMFNTSNRVNIEIRDIESSTQIIKDIVELNIVTFEYLTYHEARMDQQWLQKYDSLGELLIEMGIEEIHPEHLSVLESIISDYESLGNFFSLIQENLTKREKLIEENKPQEEIDLSFSLEKRLSSQALISSQRMATEAFKYSDLMEQRITLVQQRTNSIALFSIIGFIVISFSISFFTTKAITKPLNELVISAEIIGKGNLEHRVDIKNGNEIGELAVAFNQMTEQRKRAEEEINKYSEKLEKMVDERTQALHEAQEELVRKEKMATLGELGGGVAHELRNPLGVISNSVYFLKSSLPDADDTTVEYLDMISSEIRGAIQIIENLLSLTHKEEPTMEEIPVTELVTLGLSRQVPPEGVNVTTEISSETLSLFADPSQIVHVLENLLSNAYQSMPDGGELIIKVWEDGSRVCISVTDTGWGIPKENLKKIFEPLFTTKARGFGFGLSISRDLIGMNNGSIEVNSEEGVGSSFTLKLPGVS
jgi:signal transduction histidine kinase